MGLCNFDVSGATWPLLDPGSSLPVNFLRRSLFLRVWRRERLDEKLGISGAAGPTYSCLGRKCPRLLSLALGAVEMAPITVYSLLQAAVAMSRQ
ncbi:hypothetical protein AAC387_Pa04g2652 [Persea americana]